MLADELERVLVRILALIAQWVYMLVAVVVFLACLFSVTFSGFSPASVVEWALVVLVSAALALFWPITLGMWLGRAMLP